MNTFSDRLDACDDYDAAVVEEGCRTPTREGTKIGYNLVAEEGYRTPSQRSRRIPTPRICPPPPKKKKLYNCSQSSKRKRGYDIVVVEEKHSCLQEDGCFEVHLIDELELERLFKTISTGEATAIIAEEDKAIN